MSRFTTFAPGLSYTLAMTIVYLDELAALNFLCDYLLLRATAELRGLPRRRGRCFLSALLGGAWGACAMLPPLRFLAAPPAALAASGFLTLIAFGGDGGLGKSWACFLALSAAFAGAVFFACCLLEDGGAGPCLLRCPLRTLLLSFSLFYALLCLLLRRAVEKRGRERSAVTVRLLGREAGFTALNDTGNTLSDPISGMHVLIADRDALAPLFPVPLPRGDAVSMLRALGDWEELGLRGRLVPFRSVGGGGLLLCLRPDEVLVDGARRDVLVGVSEKAVGEAGEYQAIL